jgi:hypothetical protein
MEHDRKILYAGWVSGHKVEVEAWSGHETLRFHVRYFSPGTNLNKPTWEKTIYIKDTPNVRAMILTDLGLLAELAGALRVSDKVIDLG